MLILARRLGIVDLPGSGRPVVVFLKP